MWATGQSSTGPSLKKVRWCIRLTRLTLVCEVIRYRLVQVQQNPPKKSSRVGGPQSPFSISSSIILFFVLFPFFLKTKIPSLLATLTLFATHAHLAVLGIEATARVTILNRIIGRSPARGALFTRSGERRKSGIRANDKLARSGRANDKLARSGRALYRAARQ